MPWEIESLTTILADLAQSRNCILSRLDCRRLLTGEEKVEIEAAGISEWIPLILIFRELAHAVPSSEPRVVLACQAISQRLEYDPNPLFAREYQEPISRPPLIEIKLLKVFEKSYEQDVGLQAALSFVYQVSDLGWFQRRQGICLLVLWIWTLRQFGERLPVPADSGRLETFMQALAEPRHGLPLLLDLSRAFHYPQVQAQEEEEPVRAEADWTVPALIKRLQARMEEQLSQLSRFEKDMRWQARFESHNAVSMGLAMGPWQKAQNARAISGDIQWAGEWVLSFKSTRPAFRHSRVPRNRFVLLALRTEDAVHIVFHLHIEYDVGKASQIVPETISIREVLDHTELGLNTSVSSEALENLASDCLDRFLGRLEEETARYRLKGSGAL